MGVFEILSCITHLQIPHGYHGIFLNPNVNDANTVYLASKMYTVRQELDLILAITLRSRSYQLHFLQKTKLRESHSH